jgi:hypothetical protein
LALDSLAGRTHLIIRLCIRADARQRVIACTAEILLASTAKSASQAAVRIADKTTRPVPFSFYDAQKRLYRVIKMAVHQQDDRRPTGET